MDVFLSYASEDRERARKVARVLEDAGWSVWWDRKIVAGEAFDQTIERHLEAAKCVVVLWSNASVESEWVKTEAAAAAERHVLVPALLDDVKIPLEFRRRQTANLIDWNGDTSHEGFHALREGVAARVGAAAVVRETRPSIPRPQNLAHWQRWGLVAGAVVIAAIAVLAYRAWITPAGGRQSSDTIADSSRTGGAIESDEQRRDANDPTAGLNVSRSSVVVPSGGNSVDRPAPLAVGALHKVTLGQNEEYYFRLTAPVSAMTIVEDVRLSKRDRSSNLQTRLDVLDADGGVVRDDVIIFNEVDVGYRKTAPFSTKQPSQAGFKLVNNTNSVEVWLAVLPEGKKEFLPFFGDIVPQAWSAGKDATGTLDQNADVYYVVRLARGEHRVILDFMNAKRDSTNLQGYLAVLDADGGNQQEIMRLNEIGVSYRKVGSLTVKVDAPLILRLQNASQPVNYSLRITNAQ